MKKQVVYFLALVTTVAVNAKSPGGFEAHYEASKARVLSRIGVGEGSYFKFQKSLAASQANEVRSESAQCISRLQDTDSGRSEFLECLARYGRGGLNENLFLSAYTENQKRIKDEVNLSLEKEKTKLLLFYLQDLVREQRERNNERSAWFLPNQGFDVRARLHSDFDYQDGDAILMIGNSSISSLISQATYPQRRYSHAALVRVRDNRFGTAEALIESGVVSHDMEYFKKGQLQTVTVLRWNQNDLGIREKASDCGARHVESNTPYNFSMSLENRNAMFCSQLVVQCYADASETDVNALIAKPASIRSRPVLKYLDNFGVSSEVMPSPGDIAASRFFTPVADYRRTRDPKTDEISIHRLWDLFLMGDVFIDRLESGYQIKWNVFTKGLMFPLLSMVDRLGEFFMGIVGVDRQLIPRGVRTQTLGHMSVLEITIYKDTFKIASKLNKKYFKQDLKSLLSTDLIFKRALLSYSLSQNFEARQVFKGASNK